jgi:hypothetical protein
MNTMQPIHMKKLKNKNSFKIFFKKYKPWIYQLDKSELEIDIILAYCNACKYTVITLILLGLFSTM